MALELLPPKSLGMATKLMANLDHHKILPILATIITTISLVEKGAILTTLVSILIVVALYYCFKSPNGTPTKHRFRKRDKVMFYGRRMLRRVSTIKSNLINKSNKKRQLFKLNRRGQTPQPLGVEDKPDKPTKASNISTIAILSHSNKVPIGSFCRELQHSLTSLGSVLHLDSRRATEHLETRTKTNQDSEVENESDNEKEARVSSWLDREEDNHKLVLYQCDQTLTPWTTRCLSRADCILIVAMADTDHGISFIEHQLEQSDIETRKELILLHEHGTKRPKDTTRWLNIRSWCSHHHIRCPPRMFVKKANRVEKIYSELARTNPPYDSDFARLARHLTNNSIGLVLGGGGARGIAHLGMIKALMDADIPIDMIGGVSIGAFMGALWAKEDDLTLVIQLARSWSTTMTSRWRLIMDLTYPITAMFTGADFNHTIQNVFGETQIEDLWLPYFNLTTDISSSAPRVHRHGSLWRYVRSSMSLSGYLPPLCDPIDGHLLLDGGYVNNLPADVMHKVMGAKTILAVDVGSHDDDNLTNYGDTLSGWWLLWNKWNPFGTRIRVPNLPEIQSRLAYVTCVRQLEEVKKSDYCSYLRPPIDEFTTLQFHDFDRILEVGHKYGTKLFSNKKDWPFLKQQEELSPGPEPVLAKPEQAKEKTVINAQKQ